MKPRIVDKDRGWRRVMRELTARGAAISVGIMGSEAAEQAAGGSGKTVAEIMSYHEFGVGVPRRSWLRDWFELRVREFRKRFKEAARAALDGRRPLREAADLMGVSLVGDCQKRWAEGIPPPNADSTVARKGSSTPLIDTGQARGSVTYRVEGV